MKNPLYKRVKRELKDEFGKYTALFVFLVLTIGFCSGFLVGDGSMRNAYNESFDKYNVEDGHFSLVNEAESKWISDLEDNQDIKIYELFYKERKLENGHTIRIYKNRNDVNKVDVLEGKIPENDYEIAIDRLYAENNSIKIGDTLTIDKKNYRVSATVALTDYSALFKNNSDMMFDANKFTVAVLTDDTFDNIKKDSITYCYSWTNNNKSLSDEEKEDKADEIKDELVKSAMVTDFLPLGDNQAITFAGEDIGKDKIMVEWLLYIVMAVLAFIFAVTTRNTIEKEAGVIGTLRASGYTKGELFRHYLILPLMVTFVSAIIGNALGYTFFQNLISKMYYHSYSLTTYVVEWSAEAFILTTVVPLLIILVVNILVLISSLSLSPLQYLRRDLKRNGKKKAIKLPEWKFITRFKLRIILQNKSTYFLMFIGILMSSILLVFGMMFSPLLSSFKEEVINSKIANYQYILKAPVETNTKNVEKYCVKTLYNEKGEEITVYGIDKNSKYLKELNFKQNNKIYLSDGFAEKYSIKNGDTVKLSEEFGSNTYKFTAQGKYNYPASLSVFMSRENFNSIFDKEDEYFTGYFSNEKINDIDESLIATIITEEDLTIITDQLDDSMGMIFPMFGGFAVILFILVIYLLAKIVIEKNAQSISMVKILGYSNKEASILYNRATAIVVVSSLIISMPIVATIIRTIYYVMMQEFTGWLTYYIAPWIYPVAVGIGILCYLVVHIMQSKKISKISMSEALKNME